MTLIPVRYLVRDPMGEKVSPGEQSRGVPCRVQAQLRGTAASPETCSSAPDAAGDK